MTVTPQRLGAAAGIGFIVLYLVAGVISGSSPSATASAAKITHYFSSHHSSLLAGAILSALGAALFVAWAATLAAALREGGGRIEGSVLVACATGGIVFALVPQGFNAGLAQAVRGSTDSGFVRGSFQVSQYFGHLGFWFAAVAAVAVALIAGRVFAAWFVWLTGVCAVLFGLGGISFRATGFLGVSGGGLGLIALLALLVWMLASSVLLWRTAPRGAAGRSAVASPA